VKAFYLTVGLGLTYLLYAQDVAEVPKHISEFTLPNGLHFIVAERHDWPLASFHTVVKAGFKDDPSGETGMAYLLERMAYKGTESMGSKDWAAEKKAMEAVEEAYDRWEAEHNKGPNAEEGKLISLELQIKMALERAQAQSDSGEYNRILQENGASGMSSVTGADTTDYHYSLPSNRIELWFLMESQRLLHPVFREFYRERQAVIDEDVTPLQVNVQRKFLDNFRAAAFAAQPYRNPARGWLSDVVSLRTPAAKRFFDKYYTPSNMVVAIAGDVQTAEVKRLAERYFGALPARPSPPPVHTVDPPQSGPKAVLVEANGTSLLAIGYKRPDQYTRDDLAYDVLQYLLSSGRSGLLYKQLVQQRRVASGVQVVASFPGGEYPSLFAFLMTPAPGRSPDDSERALDEVLARLMTQPLDPVEVARAKAQARASALRRLEDNAGLAALLADVQAAYGDWHKLFTVIDDLNAVTAEDVQRVAIRCFDPRSRTKAVIARGTQ
jgi:predicted Zn-dependent peptidase